MLVIVVLASLREQEQPQKALVVIVQEMRSILMRNSAREETTGS